MHRWNANFPIITIMRTGHGSWEDAKYKVQETKTYPTDLTQSTSVHSVVLWQNRLSNLHTETH